MKFSIVTVCRNSAAVLPGAMRSLEDQHCIDHEWVVVDGASTDSTEALVRGYRADRMSWHSEPDAGIYDAMNKGIARARGEYLYFLNSDDRLADPDVLGAVAAASAGGQADLVIGQVRFVDGARRQLRDYGHITPRNVVFDSLCHQAVFAHRRLFESYGGFDTRYRYAADFDWLVRVLRGGARVVHLPRVVADFSAGGAHAQAQQTTQAEVMAIRQARLPTWERRLAHTQAWLVHKARRLRGLPARGLLAIPGNEPPK